MQAPATSSATSQTQPRVRARTFLIGVPLVMALCCLSIYADMVSKVVQFGVLQIAPPAVVALLCLALFNRALVKWAKLRVLNPAELIVIYAMALVGVMVSTRGIIEKLVPPLAYLPYYATRENKFAETVSQYMPAWAMPFSSGARHRRCRQRLARDFGLLGRQQRRSVGDVAGAFGRVGRAVGVRGVVLFVPFDFAAPPMDGQRTIAIPFDGATARAGQR